MSLQAAIEKRHRNKWRITEVLALSVQEAWLNLPALTLNKVFNRTPQILELIVANDGDNLQVEEQRGLMRQPEMAEWKVILSSLLQEFWQKWERDQWNDGSGLASSALSQLWVTTLVLILHRFLYEISKSTLLAIWIMRTLRRCGKSLEPKGTSTLASGPQASPVLHTVPKSRLSQQNTHRRELASAALRIYVYDSGTSDFSRLIRYQYSVLRTSLVSPALFEGDLGRTRQQAEAIEE